MQIHEKYPLSKITTFRIGGAADFFIEVKNEKELVEALNFAKSNSAPVLILGGGSNLLISDQGFRGLVVRMSLLGKEIVEQNDEEAVLIVGSGEVWDDVVAFAVKNNLWGIENLAAIPGFSGAIPVQNVGAYGQEASFVVSAVEAMDIQSLEKKVFVNQDCGFGYRRSNFNSIWKNKYAIVSVSFKLSKSPKPNLEYADVKKYFENHSQPSQAQIREAIVEIRQGKFPDVAILGNAGSCFKNPVLDENAFVDLQKLIANNFSQETADKLADIKQRLKGKIPAAFLIDICGLKGKTAGQAKLWDKQPLVIVNTGNAKATDVVELMNVVKKTVREKTGILLETEPEIVGFNN